MLLIDVSRWQGKPNWAEVAKSGIEGAYIQATYGDSVVDPDFTYDWVGCAKNGMKRGAYHFAVPGPGAAQAQAKFFLSQLKDGFGELPPVLDLEQRPANMTSQQVVAWAEEWFSVVDAEYVAESSDRLGAVLYSYPAFIQELGATAKALAQRRLWLACYAGSPKLPIGPWKRLFAWQKDDKGRVPGINGDVDMDVLYDATPTIRWVVDLKGKPIASQVINQDGRLYLELRPLAEALGLSIAVNSKESIVHLT